MSAWLRAVRALDWHGWVVVLVLLVVVPVALIVVALFVLRVGLMVAALSLFATLAAIFVFNVTREHLAERRPRLRR